LLIAACAAPAAVIRIADRLGHSLFLLSNGVRGLVVLIRGNPGGFMHREKRNRLLQALGLAGQFLGCRRKLFRCGGNFAG
jgi:hypothetical protein